MKNLVTWLSACQGQPPNKLFTCQCRVEKKLLKSLNCYPSSAKVFSIIHFLKIFVQILSFKIYIYSDLNYYTNIKKRKSYPFNVKKHYCIYLKSTTSRYALISYYLYLQTIIKAKSHFAAIFESTLF